MHRLRLLLCKREGEAIPVAVATMLVACVAGGCATESGNRHVTPSYDVFTSRLLALYADQNGDGVVDQWTYVDGNQVLRGESDADGDGRIDQWEYFGADGRLVKVGASSRNDGVEDIWTFEVANGERRIDRARQRDRHVDRREFFRTTDLVRAEEDSNLDGRVDRWDRYEGGVLREADFDTSLAASRPNRRIVYDATGRFVRVDADDERDGTFVELHGASEIDVKGVKR